jgi:hypothetical protein
MRHGSLTAFLKRSSGVTRRGPVAVVMAEDAVEVASTLRHLRNAGFRELLLLAHPDLVLAPDVGEGFHRIDHDVFAEGALVHAVNRLIAAAPDTWFHYCHNAEYLFYPFRESRSVRDLIAFQAEERRDAVRSVVIDLYAADLARHPEAVSLEEAMFDRTGYYALDRADEGSPGQQKARQVDVFGGLRWRFEEHVPPARRRIDRVALFRARKGLELRPDHRFNDEDYNTYACAWHHSVTAALCSFRAAKALKANPGSGDAIRTFRWPGSEPFRWHSQQLMDLGMMEPGQWF